MKKQGGCRLSQSVCGRKDFLLAVAIRRSHLGLGTMSWESIRCWAPKMVAKNSVWMVTTSVQRTGTLSNLIQRRCWASLFSASEKCLFFSGDCLNKPLKVSARVQFILSRARSHGSIMPREEVSFLLSSGKLRPQCSHLWHDGQKFSPLSCLVGIQSRIFHL